MDVATSAAGRTSVGAHMDHAAGESRAVTVLTAAGTMTEYNDDVVHLDGTSAVVPYTLLSAAAVPKGRKLKIRAINVTNACSIATSGSETINGLAAYTFLEAYETVVLESDGTNWVANILPPTNGAAIRTYISNSVAFSDLGSGATDTITLTGFPANVIPVAAAVEVDTAFAGEADLALQVGDAGNVDQLIDGVTIDSVAAGWVPATVTDGFVQGLFEAAYSPIATFTATELDDVTAGALKVHIFYIDPVLQD